VNFKATFLSIHQYVIAFGGTGTVISISSGAAGVTFPGESAYSIAKMSNTRLIEYLHVEYPSIRAFSLAPGLVKTERMPTQFHAMAIDPMELVGGNTLYLSAEKAEHLRGGWISTHWDVEEMEMHAKEIKEKGLLRTEFLKGDLGAPGHQFES
jgi:NAD(P)-dependent dehydrogenase (short-subunit alcohol dehydrogenase family)